MKRWKVGILTPESKYPASYDTLAQSNCELIFGKPWEDYQDYSYREDELIRWFGQCDGLIVGGRDKVPGVLIRNSPHLKVISKSSIGVDNIDVETASSLGILVTNAPGNYLSIAEGTIALMLAVMKKIVKLDQRTRLGKWRDFYDLPVMLKGKTIGIIGFGRIGKAVTRRLQGWDVELLAYDPYIDHEDITANGAIPAELNELLARSDIITFHLILNKETYHMMDADKFALLKPNAIVINTARGGVIDEKELYEYLVSKKIAGAGLDVFEEEPPVPTNPLLKLENVVVTPHGLSITEDGRRMLIATAAEECLTALQGGEPKHIINIAALEKWKQRFLP